MTRVSAFKMSRDTSNRIFPESGVKTPFHTLSHHSEKPDLVAEFAKLNRYHVGWAAYFLGKLKDTPDGDGNLLDHSLVLYGSPMGDSNTHNHKRLPLFLAGHASGKLKGNLHRVCPDGYSACQLLADGPAQAGRGSREYRGQHERDRNLARDPGYRRDRLAALVRDIRNGTGSKDFTNPPEHGCRRDWPGRKSLGRPAGRRLSGLRERAFQPSR